MEVPRTAAWCTNWIMRATRCCTASRAAGSGPYAGVVRDAKGNFYGSTTYGGGADAVYKVSPDGQETVLHSFTGGADGGSPVASVTFSPAGDLYGTAENGGANGDGAIFKVTPR